MKTQNNAVADSPFNAFPNGRWTLPITQSAAVSNVRPIQTAIEDLQTLISRPSAGKNYDNFSEEQIVELREKFSKLETVSTDRLAQFHALFGKMTDSALVNLYRAKVKFVSKLAFNAAIRRGISAETIRGNNRNEN